MYLMSLWFCCVTVVSTWSLACRSFLGFLFKYGVWLLWTFFFFKQRTAYEVRIRDWSSDVCSSDLPAATGWSVPLRPAAAGQPVRPAATGRSVPLRPAAAGQPLWPAPAGPGPLRSGGLSAGGPAVWRRPVLPLAVRPAGRPARLWPAGPRGLWPARQRAEERSVGKERGCTCRIRGVACQ